MPRMFSNLVFVYGTLLRGETNHHLLSRCECLGAWQTPPRFTLVDVGPYPVLCTGGSGAVSGEVYAIDGVALARLDELEGYPNLYDRGRIVTPWGPAWFYFQRRRPSGARVLPGGDWRRRGIWRGIRERRDG